MSPIPEHIETMSGKGAPEEEGVVVSLAGDMARVKITKGSSCATCATAKDCPFNSLGKKDWLVWARNELGAAEGDRVKVTIGAGRYLLIAALIFIMPVATLLITYIIAKALGAIDKLAVALAVTFAFVSYFIIRSIDRHSKGAGNYDIVEIVERADDRKTIR